MSAAILAGMVGAWRLCLRDMVVLWSLRRRVLWGTAWGAVLFHFLSGIFFLFLGMIWSPPHVLVARKHDEKADGNNEQKRHGQAHACLPRCSVNISLQGASPLQGGGVGRARRISRARFRTCKSLGSNNPRVIETRHYPKRYHYMYEGK